MLILKLTYFQGHFMHPFTVLIYFQFTHGMPTVEWWKTWGSFNVTQTCDRTLRKSLIQNIPLLEYSEYSSISIVQKIGFITKPVVQQPITSYGLQFLVFETGTGTLKTLQLRLQTSVAYAWLDVFWGYQIFLQKGKICRSGSYNHC